MSTKSNRNFEDNEKLPVIMAYGLDPSVDDADEWIEETIRMAKEVKQSSQEVRRCVFFLVWYDIHKLAGMSRVYMFKDIIKKSGLNRSTIYDYVNAALVETELNITQGVMSVDALVYLKEHASKEDWQDIFDNGMEAKRVDQEIQKSKKKKRSRYPRKAKAQNEYLTKEQVKDSIKNHNRQSRVDNGSNTEDSENSKTSNVVKINSPKSGKKRKSKLADWGSKFIDPLKDTKVEYVADDYEIDKKPPKTIVNIEKLKKKALGMSIKKKKKMLKVFSNPSLTYPERLAFRLSKKLEPDALEKLIKEIEKDIEEATDS